MTCNKKRNLECWQKPFFSQPDCRDPEADHACSRHLSLFRNPASHLEGRKAPWAPGSHGGFVLGESEGNHSFRIQSYNCFKIIPLGPNTGSNGIFLVVTLVMPGKIISAVALGLLPPDLSVSPLFPNFSGSLVLSVPTGPSVTSRV